MGIEIREIFISPGVNQKINGKHHVSEDEVLYACWKPKSASWVHDDARGWRLFVEGSTATGRVLLVILYPTDDPGLWNLGTAYSG